MIDFLIIISHILKASHLQYNACIHLYTIIFIPNLLKVEQNYLGRNIWSLYLQCIKWWVIDTISKVTMNFLCYVITCLYNEKYLRLIKFIFNIIYNLEESGNIQTEPITTLLPLPSKKGNTEKIIFLSSIQSLPIRRDI